MTDVQTILPAAVQGTPAAVPQHSGANVRAGGSMTNGTLGMWMFLASEGMFFVAMLGAFVVLQSNGLHELYVKSSHMLSAWMGLLSVGLLAVSSIAMYRGNKNSHAVAGGTSVLFLVLQAFQWGILLTHHTVEHRDAGNVYVSDGRGLKYRSISLPARFNIHQIVASDFTGDVVRRNAPFDRENVQIDLTYGPSRNNFFGSYFLMSTVHGLHLIAGLLALAWFGLKRSAGLPLPLQIYWHFVNAMGAIAFAVLYFV